MAAVWHDLITTARNQDKLRALLDQVVNGPDTALAGRVGELLRAEPVVQAPAPPAAPGTWRHFHDPDAAERRIFRTGSYLDVSFLRRGMELSTAVARLLVTFPDGRQYHGTGFRIGEDLLLTNHHVLFDDSDPARPAARAEAWFGYEADLGAGSWRMCGCPAPWSPPSATPRTTGPWCGSPLRCPRGRPWWSCPTRARSPRATGSTSCSTPRAGEEARGPSQRRAPRRRRGGAVLDGHRPRVLGLTGVRRTVAAGRAPPPLGGDRPAHRTPEYRNQGIRIDKVTEGVRRAGRV
ncbi:hypothetical protein ACFQ60_08385 [Streptomyces zhihengii]